MRAGAPAFQWNAAIQLVLSLLGVMSMWGAALFLLLRGFIRDPGSTAVTVVPQNLTLAAGLGWCGLLLLPSAGYALLRLLGRSLRPILANATVERLLMLLLLFVVMPSALLGGDWAARTQSYTWLVLPLANVLAVSIPVLWIIHLGRNRLPGGSPQRSWGAFGSGMVLGSSLMITFEMLAIGALFFLGIVMVASQPTWLRELNDLAQRLEMSPSTPEAMLNILEPYTRHPLLIFLVGAYLAVITPLIEEACKPIGVWLLVRRSLSPAEGFVSGLLSGAGFALLESLAYSANANTAWTVTVVARLGTMLMHIFTAGLMGWGLTQAWKRGRLLYLAVAYLGAVLIHGLWNGLTVGVALVGIQITGSSRDATFFQLALAAILAISILAGLIGMNTALRRAIMAHSDSDSPSSEAAPQPQNIQLEEVTNGKLD